MELNLNVPDEMVSRLRPHENRLLQILELGLEALETSSGDQAPSKVQSRDPVPEDPNWRQAARDFAAGRQEERHREAPSPEDLQAYVEETLDDDSRDDLLERLALDSESVDDLLDLQDFEVLQPPSTKHALSDDDVRQALRGFKKRLADEETTVEDASAEDASVGNTRETSASDTTRIPGDGWPSRWRHFPLAIAATLILAIGSTWMVANLSGPNAQLSNAWTLSNTRGGQPFTLPSENEQILILLPETELPNDEKSIVRLTTGDDVVYESSIERRAGGEGTAYFTIPSRKLRKGTYRVSILGSASDGPVHEVAFEIVPPPVD